MSLYDKQTYDDMTAIAAMLERSKEAGLQTEVVFTLMQNLASSGYMGAGDAHSFCTQALEEWLK